MGVFRIKKCVICGKEITQKRFRINCSIECKKQSKKKYVDEYNKTHKEIFRKSSLAYYYRNTEDCKKRNKKWIEKNQEKIYKLRKEYWHKNKKELSIRYKEWVDKNPVSMTIKKQKRRNIEKSIIDTFPSKEIVLYRKYIFNGCCFCNSKSKLSLEHLIPIVHGGTNDELNLFGSCVKCNNSKNSNNWEVWFKRQDFYNPKRVEEIKKLSGVSLAKEF